MDNWYENHASDHRGRPVHAGKRTAQGFKVSNYGPSQPPTPYSGGSMQDYEGPEPVGAYRKTPKKKGPGGAGVAKGY